MKERVELFFHALVQYEITVELNEFLQRISSLPRPTTLDIDYVSICVRHRDVATVLF